VLGHVLPAGGEEGDGLAVIGIVTRHPATARTIATKLARRFVSDEPPPAVVDRVARAYRDTDGDIRAMMRALVGAPEFWSEAAWNAKFKKPIELVASAARALDAQPGPETGPRSAGFHLARATSRLGERLFYAQPPTGHPDTAEAWMNTGTLLARLNFAVALAHNRLPGVRVDLKSLLGDVDRRRLKKHQRRQPGGAEASSIHQPCINRWRSTQKIQSSAISDNPRMTIVRRTRRRSTS